MRRLPRVRPAAEAAVELVLAALEKADDVLGVLGWNPSGRPEHLDGVQNPVAQPRPAGVEAGIGGAQTA